MAPPKLTLPVFKWLILLTSILVIYIYASIIFPFSKTIPPPSHWKTTSLPLSCNLFRGHWIIDSDHKPLYDETCPFHRKSWNCFRNKRDNMDKINSWKWVPENCASPRIDPFIFLGSMRNRRIGFVGDSLNENFLVSFLCSLRVADGGAKKWKRKGAWRGGYFPKFNVTIAYHRAVLLTKYQEAMNQRRRGTEEGGTRGDKEPERKEARKEEPRRRGTEEEKKEQRRKNRIRERRKGRRRKSLTCLEESVGVGLKLRTQCVGWRRVVKIERLTLVSTSGTYRLSLNHGEWEQKWENLPFGILREITQRLLIELIRFRGGLFKMEG